jgi:hypothetical protein
MFFICAAKPSINKISLFVFHLMQIEARNIASETGLSQSF